MLQYIILTNFAALHNNDFNYAALYYNIYQAAIHYNDKPYSITVSCFQVDVSLNNNFNCI